MFCSVTQPARRCTNSSSSLSFFSLRSRQIYYCSISYCYKQWQSQASPFSLKVQGPNQLFLTAEVVLTWESSGLSVPILFQYVSKPSNYLFLSLSFSSRIRLSTCTFSSEFSVYSMPTFDKQRLSSSLAIATCFASFSAISTVSTSNLALIFSSLYKSTIKAWHFLFSRSYSSFITAMVPSFWARLRSQWAFYPLDTCEFQLPDQQRRVRSSRALRASAVLTFYCSKRY